MLIKNALVANFNESPCLRDIYIESGIIVEVGENISKDLAHVIDAKRNFAIPGLIDMYCQIGEPGYEFNDDIISASKSAARGGFTSITCTPNTNPVIDNKTVVDYLKLKYNALSIVNIFPYGSITVSNNGTEIAEIGQMVSAGVVGLCDGGCCVSNSSLMRKIMLYSSMFDVPLITTCDVVGMSQNGVINRGKTSTKMGLLGIPREAEEIMVNRDVILAKYNTNNLHITHISTAGSAQTVTASKSFGIKLTCDTAAHYFSLSEEIVESYNTLGKVKPPLRTREDVDAIKKALIDGTIDVITSGHTPVTIDSKQMEFDRASFGISSLETAFCVSFTELVKSNLISLSMLIEKMCKNPANILRLDNKGEIRAGYDADILIFDGETPFKINAQGFSSKAKFSPYNGMSVFGDVLYTIVNGKVVYLK